ncbi:MAG: hypothetical protein R3C61_21285 [Bacteroidia bacterium]
MKKMWAWIAQNPALTYLFFTQVACIILGIYWGFSSLLSKQSDSQPANFLITVAAYENSAREIVAAYNSQAVNEYDVQLLIKSEEEGVKTFAATPNALLVMPRKLTPAEVALLDAKRLPLSQEAVFPDQSPGNEFVFLIGDHQQSAAEGKFLSFITNPSQPRRFAPRRRG